MISRHVAYGWIILAVAAGCLLDVGDASAQMLEDNTTAGPIDAFRQAMLNAQATISGLLAGTFWALATIEFAFAMFMVVLHDQGLEGFGRELVIRILFIGFFWTLLQNGADWINSIVATFADLGSAAGGIGTNALSPDGIVDTAVTMIKDVSSNLSVLDLGTSIAFLVAGLITFMALLLIAANLALVLVEFYIVGYGGIVLLALGGSRWTSNYAVAYIKYAFSIGMRLFILYVLAGIGVSEIQDRIVNDLDVDNINQFWTLAGFAVILCIVASRAPDAVTGLLNGVSTQASMSMGSAARIVGSTAQAAVSGGASALGGASAVGQAVRLGSQQQGSTSLNAAANLMKAGMAEGKAAITGKPTSGSAFPGRGTVGGRMAANMANVAKSSASSAAPSSSTPASAPPPPSTGPNKS